MENSRGAATRSVPGRIPARPLVRSTQRLLDVLQDGREQCRRAWGGIALDAAGRSRIYAASGLVDAADSWKIRAASMQEHTRLARARRGLERRLFLKALGLGLTAPLAWELCRSATAHAQEARPKRLMVFFTPHGMPPEHFNPIVTGGVSGSDFTFVAPGRVNILEPLEQYKQYVNVLQGFEYPGASTHEGILTVLSNYGTANDELTARTSFEHVIANGLGARPLVLGALAHRVWGIDKDGKLMWDGQPVVPEKNPLLAFQNTFAGVGGNTDPQAAVKQQLRDALTTLTEGQLSSLGNELRSVTRVQSKLQVHLEAVQALRGGAGGQQSCQTIPTLPAVEVLREAAQGQTEEFFLREDNFPLLLAAQLEVAAQAIICNATPVVAVQAMYANADINFAFMGSPGSHHSSLSHTGPQAQGTGLALEPRTPFANAQKWFYQQLVEHVVSRLTVPDPADPGRQVIDNTIIYAFSEIGEGAWHTSRTQAIQLGATPNAYAYMPIITIGGGGGALRTGQVVNVNPNAAGTDRPAGDVYLALCRAMGVTATSFGNATNPVTEILV